MSVIKSTTVYSPQNFVEALTGLAYIFRSNDDVEEIHKLLRQNGVETDDSPLWDYPLGEIDEVVTNKVPVVLVEVMHWNDELMEFSRELRWFEVPEGFEQTVGE